MTEAFCHTAISERLLAATETVYASYLSIRGRIAKCTKNFQPFYNQLSAVMEQALGDELWRPTHVSNVALGAIREALSSSEQQA